MDPSVSKAVFIGDEVRQSAFAHQLQRLEPILLGRLLQSSLKDNTI